MATLPVSPKVNEFNSLSEYKTAKSIKKAIADFERSGNEVDGMKVWTCDMTGVLDKEENYDEVQDNLFKNPWFVQQLVKKLDNLEDIKNLFVSTFGYVDWDKVKPAEFNHIALKLYKRAFLWTYTAEYKEDMYVINFLNTFFVEKARSILIEAQEVFDFDVDKPLDSVYDFDKATLTEKDLTFLLHCKNLYELSIKGFGISEEACEFLRRALHSNQLKNIRGTLRVLRLEDVYFKPDVNPNINFETFLRNRHLPLDFINIIEVLPYLEVLDISAIFISVEMTQKMEEWLGNNKSLIRLRELSLVDCLTTEKNRQRLDDVLFNIIKQNEHEKMKLKLSIQRQTYGVTLLRKLFGRGVNVKKIHVIVNENALNHESINLIKHYQDFCDGMTVTFHETYFHMANDPLAATEMVTVDFNEWHKVSEVIIGNDIYFYRTKKMPKGRLHYVIMHLPNLLNMKTLRIEDKLSNDSFEVLHSMVLPHIDLEEFSIRNYDNYPQIKQQQPALLLNGLSSYIRTLILAPFPFESDFLKSIPIQQPLLQKLVIYAPEADIPSMKEEFRKRFLSTSKLIIRTGNIAVETRNVAIPYWLANVRRMEHFVF